MSNLINTNIESFKKLINPEQLIHKFPLNNKIEQFIINSRKEIESILNKSLNKKIIIVGPCSIHNIEEAKVYGKFLKTIISKVKDKICIIMRVYFEKPRTNIGWKGLINDPNLDNTFDVNKGISQARELLLYLNSIEIPCAYEILDTITPQYISDLISWGAIGARTSESQVHRQIVSGLSMPVGFKNSTNGSINGAINGIISSSHTQCFTGITNSGEPAIITTKGNKYTHIILRGSDSGPNYSKEYIDRYELLLKDNKLNLNIMVDCSHGNSKKDYKNQKNVISDVINQIQNGNKSIIGIMIESNIYEGSQKLTNENKTNLKYGVSITDSCINIEETGTHILNLYEIL